MTRTAILTGDVVRSTLTGTSTRDLARRLRRAGELAGELASGMATPVESFRGDAWQMAVRPPSDAIAVAIRFRIALRWFVGGPGADTRVSIGIGAVARLPRAHVSEGDGPAYRLSGRGLDGMPRGRRMAVGLEDRGLEATLDAILGLVDTLVSGWTEPQAYAVDGALMGWTQEQTAAAWEPRPVTQQAVNKHLKRAGWSAVERALRRCEELLSTP